MKKQYKRPKIEVMQIELQQIVCTSQPHIQLHNASDFYEDAESLEDI